MALDRRNPVRFQVSLVSTARRIKYITKAITSDPSNYGTFKPESDVASDKNVQNMVRSDVTGDLVYSAPAQYCHYRSCLLSQSIDFVSGMPGGFGVCKSYFLVIESMWFLQQSSEINFFAFFAFSSTIGCFKRSTVIQVVKLDLLLLNFIMPTHNDSCGSFVCLVYICLCCFLNPLLLCVRSYAGCDSS